MEIGIVPAKSMTGIVEEVMMAAVGIVSFFLERILLLPFDFISSRGPAEMVNQNTSSAINAFISAGKAALYALLVAGPDILTRGRNRAQIKSHGQQSA